MGLWRADWEELCAPGFQSCPSGQVGQAYTDVWTAFETAYGTFNTTVGEARNAWRTALNGNGTDVTGAVADYNKGNNDAHTALRNRLTKTSEDYVGAVGNLFERLFGNEYKAKAETNAKT